MATKNCDQSNQESMPIVKSCGVLLMKPNRDFLLMKHRDRYDLPKGHMENNETEIETALREVHEETGIGAEMFDIDPKFRFEMVYYPTYKRFGGRTVKKTVVFFLGRLKSDKISVVTSEHPHYQWFPWQSPPVQIESKSIDDLIVKVHEYLNS